VGISQIERPLTVRRERHFTLPVHKQAEGGDFKVPVIVTALPRMIEIKSD
jgi:hypothetical protein